MTRSARDVRTCHLPSLSVFGHKHTRARDDHRGPRLFGAPASRPRAVYARCVPAKRARTAPGGRARSPARGDPPRADARGGGRLRAPARAGAGIVRGGVQLGAHADVVRGRGRLRARLLLRVRAGRVHGGRGHEAVRRQGCRVGRRRDEPVQRRPGRASQGVRQRGGGAHGGRRGHGVSDAVRRPERQYHRPDLGRPGPRRGVRSRVHTGGAADRVLRQRARGGRHVRRRRVAVDRAGVGPGRAAEARGLPERAPGDLRAEVVAPRAEGARRGAGTPHALHAQRGGGDLAVRGGDSPARGCARRHRRERVCGEHAGGRERGRARGAPDELRVRVCVDGGIEAERPARRRGDHRRARVLGAGRGGAERAHVARSVAPALRGRVSAGRKGGARVLFGGARVRGGGGVLRVQGQAGRRVAAPGGLLARGRERRGRARARKPSRRRTIDDVYTIDDATTFFAFYVTRAIPGEVRRFAARLGNVSVAVLVPGTFRFTPSGGRCLLPSP